MKKTLLVIAVLLLAMGALSASTSAPTPIEVVRDNYGVPHIYATTDEKALYGFGYVQAEDHLLDMLQNFLTAEGRMAEFFGRAYLNSDIQARAVMSYLDEELLAEVDSETVRLVSAFAEGINRYIREHREALPQWARDFEVTAAQVLRFAHFAMISRALGDAKGELRRGGAASALTGFELAGGSNQWVVGSSRSADGAPIFLMDPHLPWHGMNRWYEAHLVGETLTVYGASFYGGPFIVMGHNGKVAWSMTRNGPDLADVFIEELDPDDPTRYRTESGWAEMVVREELFQVEGQGAVTREIYYTRNGWVARLEPERNRALALALEGLELLNSPAQLLAMNRAESIAEFKEALAMQQLLLWNIMAADAQGNLFYVYNARLHRRSEAYSRDQRRPGWEPQARWSEEVIPFTELPQIENPKSDWMQNNNVMPWFVTEGLELKPEIFPSYLVKHGAGLNDRGQRASDLLSRAQGWTMAEALALATDTLVLKAEEHLPRIFAAYEAASPEKRQALVLAIEILQNWNRRADVDQAGMTLFYLWWHRPARERQEPVVALEAAVAEMEQLYGSIDVPWGEIHRIRRGALDLPIGGSQNPSTLWMAAGTMNEQGIIYADHGSSFTMAVKLAPRVEAYSLVPYGESEDPTSPHYSDQVLLKSRGELKRAWFYEDEVLAHAEGIVTLRPEDAPATRTVLYVAAHGDDMIITGGQLHRELEADSEVYILFTGSAGLEPETCPLITVLGVKPGNILVLPYGGPITHLNVTLAEVTRIIEELQPDAIFVQAYTGGHPAHEMTHLLVAEALKRVDITPEVYEFPMQTGYYGRLPSNANLDELIRFWFTLIPLPEEFAQPITDLELTPEEQRLKLELVRAWNIDWMMDLLGRFSDEEAMDFLDNEKYRPLPPFDYTEPPYGPNEWNPEGKMLYELTSSWPYTFADFRNYVLNLRSGNGADIWTVPGATYIRRELQVREDSFSFVLHVFNKSDEVDTFRLSAALDEERNPVGSAVSFKEEEITLSGGETRTVGVTCNAAGALGRHVLWLRADSALAAEEGQPTSYIEIPLMVNILRD